MKTMKVALLATAALAAVSVSARADDAAAIKAQLEALTARIAQLEAAPAAPVGYSLLSVSEGPATQVPGLETLNKDIVNKNATIIGVLPAADVPASTTIEWSGYVRAAIMYQDVNYSSSYREDDDSIDVPARGQLKVVGKTDTAVGEVGAQIQLRGDFGGTSVTGGYSDSVDTKATVKMNEAWGWWAMTPELTLGGGYTGSLGNIGYGYDGACNCYYTDNYDSAFNPGDTTQMRLSYASGPVSFGVAVEDATGSNFFSGSYDSLGAAAEIKFSGDTMNGEISAVWRDGYEGGVDSYQLGAGLGFALGDMASLSLAAAMGRTNWDNDFWGASALLSANLSDTVHGEIAAAYKAYDGGYSGGGLDADWDILSALVGVYYEPVSQLTIGVEAEYTTVNSDSEAYLNDDSYYDRDTLSIDLVTVYRF